MKKIICCSLLLLVLLSATSCGGNKDEEARQKEREAIEKFISTGKVQYYKAIKVALRVTASAETNPEIIEARNVLLRLGGDELSLGSSVEDTSKKNVGVLDLIHSASNLMQAKETLCKTDEDYQKLLPQNIALDALVPI